MECLEIRTREVPVGGGDVKASCLTFFVMRRERKEGPLARSPKKSFCRSFQGRVIRSALKAFALRTFCCCSLLHFFLGRVLVS